MNLRPLVLALLGPLALDLAAPAGARPGTVPLGAHPVSARVQDAAERGGWRDAVLPEGFALDLATGEVTTRPEPGAAVVRWAEGRLTASVALGRVDGPEPPARGAARRFPASTRVARPAQPENATNEAELDGEAASALGVGELVAQLGDELVFVVSEASGSAGSGAARGDASRGGWGYLRVLARDDAAVTLETLFVPAAAGVDALERAPAEVRARSGATGVTLEWAAEPGARYRVERRLVGAAAPDWRELALVRAEGLEARFADDAELGGRLAEYRVARVGGSAPAFGARARGAWPWWPIEEALELRPEQHLSLFTGECSEAAADFRVELVHANGVQLSCAKGALVQSTVGGPRREWIATPPELAQVAASERVYLPVGRDATARLACGVYARLVLEAEGDGRVVLRRQVDLAGGLCFPEPPPVPTARWSAERGVELAFAPLDVEVYGRALEPAPAIVLERETPFESGLWVAVASGAPGERALVDPVFPDPAAGPGGLWPARYRAVHRWLGVESLPSEPVVVVVGDDADAGGARVEAAVGAALEGLGAADFERRRAARRLLEELGERAGPRLREALGSDDPDVATAAAEILRGASERGGAAAGGSAGLAAEAVLRARAAEQRLAAEPPPGFLAPAPLGRAGALLARRAAGDAGVRAWRSVLAAADPAPGVRLVARVLVEREPDSLAELASWRRQPGEGGAARRPLALELADWTALFAAEPGLDRTRRLVEAALDPARPREALVHLSVLWRLAVARADGEDPAEAVERAQLAVSLVHAARALSDPSYLDAALGLFDDPRVRLRALRDLADLRFARLAPLEVAGAGAGSGSGSAGSAGSAGASGSNAASPTGAPGAGGAAPERMRDELEEPSLEALAARLEALSSAGLRDVDLVLPQGEYGDGSGITALAVPGLRLVGGPGVVLRTALRVGEVEDVVLEGLELRSATSLALTVQNGSCLVRDCVLEATNTHVQGYDAVVELERCRFEAVEGRPATGVRTAGASLLLARDCAFELESGAASVSGVALIEGCVATSGARPVVDASAGSWIALVDVYVRAEGVALSKVADGLLVGVVVDSDAPAARGLGADVEICPKSVLATGSPGELATRERLPVCPLER